MLVTPIHQCSQFSWLHLVNWGILLCVLCLHHILPYQLVVWLVQLSKIVRRHWSCGRVCHYYGYSIIHQRSYAFNCPPLPAILCVLLCLCTGSHLYTAFLLKVCKLAETISTTSSRSPPQIHHFYWSCIMFLTLVFEIIPDLQYQTNATLSCSCVPTCPYKTFHLFALLLEVALEIFSHVPRHDLLHLRVVSRVWCSMTTCFTHDRLRLCLPRDWETARDRNLDFQGLVLDMAVMMEVAAIYMMHSLALAWAVHVIELVNWPLHSTCFFYHVFPHIQDFVFKGETLFGISGMFVIPMPYTLLPTLQSVSLNHCSMVDNSIEELLGPGSHVETLSLDHVYHRHVVCTSSISCFSVFVSLLLIALSSKTWFLSSSSRWEVTHIVLGQSVSSEDSHHMC